MRRGAGRGRGGERLHPRWTEELSVEVETLFVVNIVLLEVAEVPGVLIAAEAGVTSSSTAGQRGDTDMVSTFLLEGKLGNFGRGRLKEGIVGRAGS